MKQIMIRMTTQANKPNVKIKYIQMPLSEFLSLLLHPALRSKAAQNRKINTVKTALKPLKIVMKI